jgi:hypothetical protein
MIVCDKKFGLVSYVIVGAWGPENFWILIFEDKRRMQIQLLEYKTSLLNSIFCLMFSLYMLGLHVMDPSTRKYVTLAITNLHTYCTYNLLVIPEGF